MVTSTASVSSLIEFSFYVGICHVILIDLLFFQHCSTCDVSQRRSSRHRSCSSNCSSTNRPTHHHITHHTHQNCYHHRRPAIRQTKRCTFSQTTTTIISKNDIINEENPHMPFQSQSSNSSNASSIRIIE